MFPELRETLRRSGEHGIVGESVYLVSERGGPFTKESFGNWVRDVCNRAGLPQSSAHGLRKAFVVQMIFRRVRPQEIMAITGHGTQKESDRFARDFLRREAALRVYEDLCREHGFETQGDIS
jgi:integrase